MPRVASVQSYIGRHAIIINDISVMVNHLKYIYYHYLLLYIFTPSHLYPPRAGHKMMVWVSQRHMQLSASESGPEMHRDVERFGVPGGGGAVLRGEFV